VFFKVLAAIVTADAVDRRMRNQQHAAWAAEYARRHAVAAARLAAADANVSAAGSDQWEPGAPERRA